jgi:hypothetical protein
MALVINDRVKETTTTTGTGAVSLGGAVTGFETFAAGVGNSNTTYYAIVHQTAAEFEVGLGTLDGDSSDLTRTTVISSSNSDSAVDFAAGTKDVFCTIPASKLIFEDANNDATVGRNLTVTGDLTVSGDDITMATNTSGAALIGDGTNFNPVAISGDISIAANGTAAIGSGVIVNADVNASAAIAMSKTAFSAGTGVSLSTNTLNVDAAQTGITSILAADVKIGEDDQTKIDFETADTINFYANNEKQLILTDGALTPGANNILDLGSASVEFKDAFFDGTVTADAFAGPLTGNVTGNASGTAATVTGAAQSNITSLGTLTTLTVDDITINGSTISDGGDLLIDAEGDISLDANGANVIFKDDGTSILDISNSSTDAVLTVSTQDKALIIKGDDAGAAITALTIDMADAGKLLPNNGMDLNGKELILDADADTSITADTDDQIDIKIAGADDFQFTANTFTIAAGSTIVNSGTMSPDITSTGKAAVFGF